MRNVFILTITFLVASLSANSQVNDSELEKIQLSWQLITAFYVDSVNTHELAEEAIIAMLEKLDPHSVYIPAEEVKAMNEPLDGNFEGIGIEFMILKDTLLVVSTIPGGPSEKVGMMAGDRILEIDGENVAGIGLTNSDVFDMLRGPKGTEVQLTILRDDRSLNFIVERDEIPIHSVEASYLISPETGYIKISRFSQSTHQEFREGLKELKETDIENLVLDLRGNGGGYLKAALDIADEFIGERRLLLYTDGMAIPRSEYHSKPGDLWEKGKLIVLIDEGSASASEIVAGAVQDWDRGIIMGRRSFGKGLVQRPFTLQDGSEIRLTIARYFTPSGRSIQKPYDNGLSEYHSEIFERFEHGEFMYADSVHMPDSLVYNTLEKKRKVYGGGGIVPDVFIPMDTAYYTDYYRDLVASGTMNRLVMDMLDENREMWKEQFPAFSDFSSRFEVPDSFIDELVKKGEENDIIPNRQELSISEYWIRLQIKALIARNLWDTGKYYQVINPALPFFDEVIELVESEDKYSKVFEKR
ncbi:MAG: carboxyl-terminal processing protease [Anaerophaga sp.]|nr:carboxyl-terminal processing protease [Anaerophaga sp.]MDN5290693.1 carboxyl-terminal processing protease [Anaerophaga sp.]